MLPSSTKHTLDDVEFFFQKTENSQEIEEREKGSEKIYTCIRSSLLLRKNNKQIPLQE